MAAAPAGKREAAEMVERIERRILMIRGFRVVLDADLAALYGVPAKRLNEQVKRNVERVPDDFVCQLTKEEAESLRSQFATSKRGAAADAPALRVYGVWSQYGGQRAEQ